MKKRIIETIVCPACKKSLESVTIIFRATVECYYDVKNDEIEEGGDYKPDYDKVVCVSCDECGADLPMWTLPKNLLKQLPL